jgi:PfaD family protein
MLCEAGFADVASGPAPDMFEMGAEVQVLSRGTMYAQRAGRLHDAYTRYARIEDIPAAERERIEKQILQRTFDEVWADTESYWKARDARELQKAAAEPRHKMALCFRWYLGMTSRWARMGEVSRKRDFQIWCGPAMGGFNDWVRGSALAPLAARGVVDVNLALLRGACVAMRLNAAQAAGAPVPSQAWRVGVAAAG